MIVTQLIFFCIKSSACSITVSNTTCCCNHTILLLVLIYICLLEWFNFSRSIEFTYLVNCFIYLLVSSRLLTGQLSTLSTLVFSFSLSFFSLLHWNIRRFTVCVPCSHGHSGLPISYCAYFHDSRAKSTATCAKLPSEFHENPPSLCVDIRSHGRKDVRGFRSKHLLLRKEYLRTQQSVTAIFSKH
jgi:hypothetical protein